MAAPHLSPPGEQHHVELRGVSKSFGTQRVLEDINIQFARGEINQAEFEERRRFLQG